MAGAMRQPWLERSICFAYSFGMTRFDKFCLVMAVAVTALCARRSFIALEDAYRLRGYDLAVAVVGWLIATYVPIAAALLFRRWTSGQRVKCPLHFLFALIAYAAFYLGGRLMLSVIGHPDFDATLGDPVMPGLLLFIIAIVAYAVAALVDLAAAIWSHKKA